MSLEPINIIIVEDDSTLRESIIEYLTLVGYQVTGVGSGREFYRALDAVSYNIAIIDIGLPDQCGLVLVEYIHANTTMGVIVLTARDGELDQLKGYEAGADLYLTKPVNSRVLATAIARLANRLNPTSAIARPEEAGSGWILDQTSWMLLSPQNITVPLTALELKFLILLGEFTGSVISRTLLLQRLYQDSSNYYSSRALDAMVRRLRQKLPLQPGKPNPIKSSYGIGYGFTEPLRIR